MSIRLLILSTSQLVFCEKLTAQCSDTIVVSAASDLCQSEVFEPLSIDSSYNDYKWIFNPANINSTSTFSSLGNFGGDLNANTNGFSIYKENGNYFGFAKLNNAQGLKRLDFGASLDNVPLSNSVYVPPFTGNTATSTSDVEILRINNQWFGYTPANQNSSIVRYNFGDSLNSDSVSVTVLPNLNGQLNFIFDLEVILFQDSIYILVASFSNNRIVIYNMGIDPNNNSPIWYKTINPASLSPSAASASGVTGFITCEKKVVFCTGSTSDNVLRLDFGNSFQNTPTVSQINSTQVDYPVAPKLLFDKGHPELFVKSRSAAMNLSKFSFKDSIDQPASTIEKATYNSNNYPMLGFAMDIHYAEDAAYVFVVAGSGSSAPGILQKMRFTYSKIGETNMSYSKDALIGIDSTGKHFYSLQVKDSLGTILFKRDSIVVTPSPIFSLTIDKSCFGETTTFKAMDSINLVGTTWQWDLGATGGTALGDSAFIQYADTGMKTVTLVGMVGTCSDTISSSFRIFDLPVASFVVDSTCQNQTLFISQNSQLSAYDSVANFHWVFGNDTIIGYNPSYSFADSGSKNIHLIIQTLNQCVSSAQQTVFIKQNPISNFSIKNTCLNDTTSFTNLSSTNISFNSLWYFGDGDSSLLLNPTHIYSDTGVYEIAMITTASNGCSDTTIVNHIISNKPVLDLSFSDTILCQAHSLEFVNNTIIEDSLNFELLILGNDTLNLYQNSLSFPSTGNYTFGCVVSIGASCLTDTFFNIHVNPKPVISLSVDTLCQGQQTEVHPQVSLLQAQQINSYSWELEQASISLDSILIFTPEQSKYYDVKLAITTDSGCSSVYDTSIYVKAKPSIDFGFLAPLCSNTLFENQSTIQLDTADTLHSEQWYLATPTFDTILFSSPDSITFQTSILATIGAYITTIEGCYTDTNILVNIEQSPFLKMDPDTFCTGNLVSLSPNLNGSNYDYKWFFEDGTVKTLNTISHIFLEPGVPKVNLQVRDKQNSCSSSIDLPLYISSPLYARIRDSILCPNSLSTINANITVDSLDRILTYSWKVNGDLLSIDSTLFINTNEGEYNVTLELSSVFECSSIISNKLMAAQIKQPSIIMDQSYGQIPFELIASAVPNDFSSIYWLLDGDTISSAEKISYFIDQELNANISLVAIDSNNCTSTVTKGISVFDGLVDLSINSIRIEKEDYSSLIVNFSNLGNVPIYEFDFSLTDLNGLERVYSISDTLNVGRSINVSINDLYSHPEHDYALCASLLRIGFLEDLNSENNVFCNDERTLIQCFPNPTENFVNLRFTNTGTATNFLLEVYNSSGKLMMFENQSFEEGYHEYTVNLTGYNKGVYIIILRSETMSRLFKIIKI